MKSMTESCARNLAIVYAVSFLLYVLTKVSPPPKKLS